MKKLALALAVALPLVSVASTEIHIIGSEGRTRPEAIRLSADLAKSLTTLANDASDVAHKAALNGNKVRAQRFRDVAQASRKAAQEVRRTVLRPLRQGERLAVVGRAVDRLRDDFGRIGDELNDIASLPAKVQRDVADSVRLFARLRALL